MLTRLKVSGFKNLVDVDVRFGPFTCIAGANGVGKSNLFDAIRFLSELTEKTLDRAALSIRDKDSKTGDVRSIFTRIGNQFAPKISFELEMIVPREGYDELNQKAIAKTTFLKYELEIGFREKRDGLSTGTLEILKEELGYIKTSEKKKHLPFNPSREWIKTAVMGQRTSKFITTETNTNGELIVKRHQDGKKGKTLSFLATNLPKTVLSSVTAIEAPTAMLAKLEMKSWSLLQLEPTALRKPDEFNAPSTLGTDGSHLPATLYRMAQRMEPNAQEPIKIYTQVANRLAELIENVKAIHVERDNKRELLTLRLTDSANTAYPAQALSDGTLRFLALTVLELDTTAGGLLCLEEPENGIHPSRIPAILKLLSDIATDIDEPIDETNPLRQVIINTHSPTVVQNLNTADLICATLISNSSASLETGFRHIEDSWRSKSQPESTIHIGDLLAYLNAPEPPQTVADHSSVKSKAKNETVKTVGDYIGKTISFINDPNFLNQSLPTP
jgi:predicted ATPase